MGGDPAIQTEPPAGRFSSAVESIVRAIEAGGLAEAVSDSVLGISELDAAGLYVPADEQHLWQLGAVSGDAELLSPSIRIDTGVVASLLESGRIAAHIDANGITELGTGGAEGAPRTVWAVPLRDAHERVLGVVLAAGRIPVGLDDAREYRLFRIRPVVEGALVAAEARQEHESALAILPELVDVAHAVDEPIAQQLQQLSEIVARATRSDGALVRVRDAAATYVETRAAWSRTADGAGEVVGLRSSLHDGLPAAELGEIETDLQHPADTEDWSPAGSRTLDGLGARRVAIFPIESAYNRQAALWLTRAADRPMGDIDRAVARMVTSHLQHIIDRHVGRLQTARATTAAHSAIRLLGRALVAGVKPEQTLRFIPRLYHEMFGAAGARLWRATPDGGLTRIAGSGTVAAASANPVVLEALGQPLELHLATGQRPHVAAIAMTDEHGAGLAVEFELRFERTLGRQEQVLAADVAERVAQALGSAERAASRQRQLERVAGLQEVLAAASEALAEEDVIAAILERLPDAMGAREAAVLVVGDTGSVRVSATEGVSEQVVDALTGARHWAPGASGDDRSKPMVVPAVGAEPRMEMLAPAYAAAGWSDAAAIATPMTVADGTVGGIVLYYPDGSLRLAEGDEGLLEILGAHLARAVLNARTTSRIRVRAEQLQARLEGEREASRQVRALYEVSRTFATSLSMDETMRAVVQAMADRLDVDAVWLSVPDHAGRMAQQAFHAVHPELGEALQGIVDTAHDSDDPVVRDALQGRQAVLVTGDDLGAAEYRGSRQLNLLAPFLERGATLAVVPVATPNEVLGTVTLLSVDVAMPLTRDKVDIAAGVASQAALALDNARLYQQQKHFAEVIQESLLPTRLPRVDGIELGVLYRSASGGGAEVGGDFYDFLELDDGRLAVVLGDVCGKGVGAAADTAMTKYTFRALAREHPSPGAFLRYANEVIAEEIALGKFVTLFYAVVDPVAGTVTCGTAGHPEPKLLTAGAGDTEPTVASVSLEGLALGIMPDQDYEEQTFPFPEGTSLVIYTDGVVEARQQGRLYGQYRLERRLLDEGNASAPQLAFAIYQDCAAYAEGGLGDDVAIVVVQHVPGTGAPQ